MMCLHELLERDCVLGSDIAFVVSDDTWRSMSSEAQDRFAEAHCFRQVTRSFLWDGCYEARGPMYVKVEHSAVSGALLAEFEGVDDEAVEHANVYVQGQTGAWVSRVLDCDVFQIDFPIAYGYFEVAPFRQQIWKRNVRPRGCGLQISAHPVPELSCCTMIVSDGGFVVADDSGRAAAAFDRVDLGCRFCGLGSSKVLFKYGADSNRRSFAVYLVILNGAEPLFAVSVDITAVSKRAYLSEEAKAQFVDARGGYRKRSFAAGVAQ